jgi:hypothetical protein
MKTNLVDVAQKTSLIITYLLHRATPRMSIKVRIWLRGGGFEQEFLMGLSSFSMAFLGLCKFIIIFLIHLLQLVNMFSVLFNAIDSKELMLVVCGSPS